MFTSVQDDGAGTLKLCLSQLLHISRRIGFSLANFDLLHPSKTKSASSQMRWNFNIPLNYPVSYGNTYMGTATLQFQP